MKTIRALLISFAAILTMGAGAQAQYPSKPIRLIVPYSPGGSADNLMRLIASRLSSRFGQPVLVDNKPGGGTMVASRYVAKAAADGYTILVNGSSLPIYTSVYSKSNSELDPLKEFVPVTMMVTVPHILVVHPSVPVNSVKELIGYAKQEPGKLSYGTVGLGSITHLEGELFKSLAGTHIVPVHYKGSAPALSDLLPGRIQLMFDTINSAEPHIKAGKLKALAVSTSRRSVAMPDVPTMAEAGVPGFEAVPWIGLLAPIGTPSAVVESLNTEVKAVLAEKQISEKLLEMGMEVVGEGPQPFGKFFQNEFVKWGKVAKEASIKLD